MTKLDTGRAWRDAMAMLAAHRELIVAVAGVFIVLPTILIGWGLPFEDCLPTGKEPVTPEELATAVNVWFKSHWLPLVLGSVISALGSLAILNLLLDRSRPTVAEALRGAVGLLLGYILANLMQTFIIVPGLFLFLLPGLYFASRLALIGPVAVAERQTNPLTLLSRSFILTHGNGLRVLGLGLVVGVTGLILSYVVNMVLGTIFLLALPAEVADVMTVILSSITSAMLSLALLLVSAAVYRQLAE